jgi:hypothetical protein
MAGGTSGNDLADRAPAIRPDLNVLYTSGYAEASIRNGRALAARTHLLGKPYRKGDLAAKLRAVLEDRH